MKKRILSFLLVVSILCMASIASAYTSTDLIAKYEKTKEKALSKTEGLFESLLYASMGMNEDISLGLGYGILEGIETEFTGLLEDLQKQIASGEIDDLEEDEYTITKSKLGETISIQEPGVKAQIAFRKNSLHFFLSAVEDGEDYVLYYEMARKGSTYYSQIYTYMENESIVLRSKYTSREANYAYAINSDLAEYDLKNYGLFYKKVPSSDKQFYEGMDERFTIKGDKISINGEKFISKKDFEKQMEEQFSSYWQ